ncbi:hypothetical protein MLD38_033411 [Melastoma candidum]|uniref:Uncharacterized protein n=1 Tax=Melastoma candidum TaxID=119954 RepID=A0ACB9M8S1_9MYRT|nr:hypothetical protein MLD38_033411 [Melastoma candidum]
MVTFMQEHKQGNPEDGPESSSIRRQCNDGKAENGKPLIPRQFMELGLAIAGREAEDHLSSPSGGRSSDQLGSPVKAREYWGSRKIGTRKISRSSDKNQSPDQEWLLNNKATRLRSPSKRGADQTESVMRKARVSVRAQSAAAMVRGSVVFTV